MSCDGGQWTRDGGLARREDPHWIGRRLEPVCQNHFAGQSIFFLPCCLTGRGVWFCRFKSIVDEEL